MSYKEIERVNMKKYIYSRKEIMYNTNKNRTILVNSVRST